MASNPARLHLEVMPPRLEGVPPLPLPVALLPPLRPGEAALGAPAGLVVLVAVGVGLHRGEASVWEHLLQPADEERLQAAACLSHLRVGLRLGGETEQHITASPA